MAPPFWGPLVEEEGEEKNTRLTVLFACRRLRQLHVLGWFGWFFLRFIPCCVYRPRDAPHHGRYAPEGQLLEVYKKIGYWFSGSGR